MQPGHPQPSTLSHLRHPGAPLPHPSHATDAAAPADPPRPSAIGAAASCRAASRRAPPLLQHGTLGASGRLFNSSSCMQPSSQHATHPCTPEAPHARPPARGSLLLGRTCRGQLSTASPLCFDLPVKAGT
eukprot:141041-Chlamydomonas_euryale.AAC.6